MRRAGAGRPTTWPIFWRESKYYETVYKGVLTA